MIKKGVACFITTSVFCFLFSARLHAQAVPDTSLNKPIPDSARAHAAEIQHLPNDAAGLNYKPLPFEPNPKKAAFYSAIFPGLGQIYNRQYWKLPIIYAGLGVAGYFIIDNSNHYNKYRKIYIARLQGNTSDGLPYSTNDIKILQDAYKGYLDLDVLLTAVGYTVQILDALAFAHLKNFDISKDISMRVQPFATPQGLSFGLAVNFK